MNFLIAKIFTAVTISMAGLAYAYDAYNAPSALPVTPPVTVSLTPLLVGPTTGTLPPLTDCQYALQLARQAGWPLIEMGTAKARVRQKRLTNLIPKAAAMACTKLTAFGADLTSIGP